MESYNKMVQEDSSHHHQQQQQHQMNMKMSMGQLIQLQSAPARPDNYFYSSAVKNKGVGVSHPYSLMEPTLEEDQPNHKDKERNENSTHNNNISNNQVEAMKAKIIAHPQYSNLLQAYIDCQKVGAPPEVAERLSGLREEYQGRQSCQINASKDPELDQFMEAYYDMLVKYREELARPIQEAMEFMTNIHSQLNLLTNGRAPLHFISEDRCGQGMGNSSEEDQETSGGETELPEIDPRAEDRELKNHLLKKYSGYLGSLKQELSKKKKKGKLPKEARHKLLSWWELHYKWPYPSESDKVGLGEATGLDQKQINNWFINQRKRHWKPSEDMQLMVMEGIHPQPHNGAFYMESQYMGEGVDAPYRFGT